MLSGPLEKSCCAAALIAPALDGRSTWHFNHGHLRSTSPSMLATPCPSVDSSRRISTAAVAHRTISFITNLAVLTSKVMDMLRFSAPKPTIQMCCHGSAASILGVFDCRWPWSKYKVDRPSGAVAITTTAQHPFF
eukprot:scaffold51436_cov52-Cyclotella_meneghiniana.AAC.2